MTMNIDFTGVQSDGDFDNLPEGVYNVSVFEVKVKENNAGDGHYLNWQLKVQDDGYNNRRLFYNTSLKSQSLWKLKQVLNRIAPDVDWSKQYSVEEIIETVEGLPCRAEVSIDTEYDNNSVDDILKPKGSDGSGSSKDEDDDLPI